MDPSHLSSWLRFLHNYKTSKKERIQGELTHEEIRDAEIHIVKEVQQDEVATEYQQLLTGKQVKRNIKLVALQARIDEDGLLRCIGRLRYADIMPYDARHSIILPRKNWVTKLLEKSTMNGIIMQVEQTRHWQLSQLVFGYFQYEKR